MMKAGKKMLENRIEEFCRTSSQLLQNIHVRCGEAEGAENGQQKRGRKKRTKKKQ